MIQEKTWSLFKCDHIKTLGILKKKSLNWPGGSQDLTENRETARTLTPYKPGYIIKCSKPGFYQRKGRGGATGNLQRRGLLSCAEGLGKSETHRAGQPAGNSLVLGETSASPKTFHLIG